MSNFIIKARLILEQHGKILLLAQTSKNGGKFTLPGGTVEGVEYAKETLIRECQEEIGARLLAQSLDLIHVLHKKKGKENRITIYFLAKNYLGSIHAREAEKFQGVTWCSKYNLPTKTSATVKHVIQQIIKGEYYSEFVKKTTSSKTWNM